MRRCPCPLWLPPAEQADGARKKSPRGDTRTAQATPHTTCSHRHTHEQPSRHTGESSIASSSSSPASAKSKTGSLCGKRRKQTRLKRGRSLQSTPVNSKSSTRTASGEDSKQDLDLSSISQVKSTAAGRCWVSWALLCGRQRVGVLSHQRQQRRNLPPPTAAPLRAHPACATVRVRMLGRGLEQQHALNLLPLRPAHPLAVP